MCGLTYSYSKNELSGSKKGARYTTSPLNIYLTVIAS